MSLRTCSLNSTRLRPSRAAAGPSGLTTLGLALLAGLPAVCVTGCSLQQARPLKPAYADAAALIGRHPGLAQVEAVDREIAALRAAARAALPAGPALGPAVFQAFESPAAGAGVSRQRLEGVVEAEVRLYERQLRREANPRLTQEAERLDAAAQKAIAAQQARLDDALDRRVREIRLGYRDPETALMLRLDSAQRRMGESPRITVSELAERVAGEPVGHTGAEVVGAAGIEEVRPGEVTFIDSAKRLAQAEATAAAAIIVPLEVTSSSKPIIRTPNPRLAFARALEVFAPPAQAVGERAATKIERAAADKELQALRQRKAAEIEAAGADMQRALQAFAAAQKASAAQALAAAREQSEREIAAALQQRREELARETTSALGPAPAVAGGSPLSLGQIEKAPSLPGAGQVKVSSEIARLEQVRARLAAVLSDQTRGAAVLVGRRHSLEIAFERRAATPDVTAQMEKWLDDYWRGASGPSCPSGP